MFPYKRILSLVLLAVFALLVSGCPVDDEDDVCVIPANIVGYWQTPAGFNGGWWTDDGFEVSADTSFIYYFDGTGDNYWRGDIVRVVPQKNSDPAVLIIHVSGSHDASGFMTLPVTGKYFAYAFKDPATTGVYSAAAYKVGCENTGCDTIAAALTEYTAANGYFDYVSSALYKPHIPPSALAEIKGKWYYSDMDFYTVMEGTRILQFMDGSNTYDSIFDTAADNEDMLSIRGDIVDCTGTGQSSGVLYIKTISASDAGYISGKYIAMAWKNKSGSGIAFYPHSQEKDSLAGIKAALNNANDTDQFADNGFMEHEKQ
jgi:hypothetical protein